LIAVRNDHRGLSLGRKLYENFIKCARGKHCLTVKSITKPTNRESIAFHKIIGMELIGNGIIDGISAVYDYSGPGEHRVVFMRDI
jgi:predicted GNAT superfamily acetyltransferase